MSVDQPGEPGAQAERESRASYALDAYRERRRRRRADDTWFGSADCLVVCTAAGVDPAELARRRIDIQEEAEAEGMSPDLAGLLYDVALDEGLDPALGYELVRSGLGVIPPPEGVENAPEQPSSDKYSPLWLTPPIPPDELLRERMLRLSFRRLRALLEQHERPEDAFRAFAREPDVGLLGY
jgi:hypothetical protein